MPFNNILSAVVLQLRTNEYKQLKHQARFEAFSVMTVKSIAFWDSTY
jgi:hypothetical protein